MLGCPEPTCTIGSGGNCAITGVTTPCGKAREVASPVGDDEPSLEERIALQLADGVEDEADQAPVEVPSGEGPTRRIHPGNELGLSEVADLMLERYGHLITLLGAHDAGKTSFIGALYLMAACGDLDRFGYAFAGSLTLPGFEERVRASRQWQRGRIPDRMSVRTEVADGRTAGFMHLDLRGHGNGRRLRLLMSDLPGEWSSELVTNARHADRLAFLPRSDAILVMVDGRGLSKRETRNRDLEATRLLLDRVRNLVSEGTRLAVVVTRGDEIGLEPPPGLAGLVAHAGRIGFESRGFVSASVSGCPTVDSGHQVMETILWATAGRAGQRRQIETGRPPKRLFGWLPVTSGGRG